MNWFNCLLILKYCNFQVASCVCAFGLVELNSMSRFNKMECVCKNIKKRRRTRRDVKRRAVCSLIFGNGMERRNRGRNGD